MAFPMSDVTAEYKLNRFIAVTWMELWLMIHAHCGQFAPNLHSSQGPTGLPKNRQKRFRIQNGMGLCATANYYTVLSGLCLFMPPIDT